MENYSIYVGTGDVLLIFFQVCCYDFVDGVYFETFGFMNFLIKH